VLTTDKGEVRIALLIRESPMNAQNFVELAKKGYFDGIVFHRVVPNFVVQGGDPRGDGNGGPGYQIRCEINQETYSRGAVGMALSGKDTGGSQFFFTHSPQPHLDGGYTVFGRVVSGMDVVDRLMRGDTIRRVRIE
jgi:cyclophilin family peptidyl-prolyl cis-trans isomerase